MPSIFVISRWTSTAASVRMSPRAMTSRCRAARFDLLNQREQRLFHQRCASVNGSTVIDWQTRLLAALPKLVELAEGQDNSGQTPPGAVWHQAMTAHDFFNKTRPRWRPRQNIVVPGCITNVSAPRSSGKSLVALYEVSLATGGVFRHERLTQRRVLLVDRDNPRSLVRKRLGWLGAHQVTSLKSLPGDRTSPHRQGCVGPVPGGRLRRRHCGLARRGYGGH